jgi:putative ABC transport system permease protein
VFNVPWLTLVIMVLLAGLAGVVAAILPSRRAAKLNVLRAIVTE